MAFGWRILGTIEDSFSQWKFLRFSLRKSCCARTALKMTALSRAAVPRKIFSFLPNNFSWFFSDVSWEQSMKASPNGSSWGSHPANRVVLSHFYKMIIITLAAVPRKKSSFLPHKYSWLLDDVSWEQSKIASPNGSSWGSHCANRAALAQL